MGSSLLIFGICQSRYKFIFPTLVWMPLDFAIYLVSILVIFLFDVYDFNNFHVVISVEIVLNLSISLICWIAVFSFWQQVKIQVGAPQRIEMQTSTIQD